MYFYFFSIFLVITVGNITTQEKFTIGKGVFKWKSINLNQKTFAIGLMSKGVTVLKAVYNKKAQHFDITARDQGILKHCFTNSHASNFFRN